MKMKIIGCLLVLAVMLDVAGASDTRARRSSAGASASLTRRLRANRHATRQSRRQLQDARQMTVSEFCGNMTAVETEMTTRFLDLFAPDQSLVDVKTPTKTYFCRCTEHTESILTVLCSLTYQFDSGTEEALLLTPVANWEQMTFEGQKMSSDSNTTYYVPAYGSWTEGVNGDDSYLLGESFNYSLPSSASSLSTESLEITSCDVVDSFCETSYDCQVCPGLQTIAYNNECLAVTCLESHNGLFLYELLIEDGIELMWSPEEDDDEEEDEDFSCQTVKDFCSDQEFVEKTITDALLSTVNDPRWQNPPGQVDVAFNCSCTEMTQDSVTMDCESQYSYPEINYTALNTEHMTWKRQEGSDYYIPESVRWTDQSIDEVGTTTLPYNETFVFTVDQEDLASCDINGCQAFHCQLCPPGKFSVLHSCPGAPTTCGSSGETANPASLLTPFRNLKLAVDACPSNATSPPAAVNKNG